MSGFSKDQTWSETTIDPVMQAKLNALFYPAWQIASTLQEITKRGASLFPAEFASRRHDFLHYEQNKAEESFTLMF